MAAGGAAVLFDHCVYFGHEADGLGEGDVVGDAAQVDAGNWYHDRFL